MYRRTFLAGLAGSAVFARPKSGVVFEAVFGAHLPQTLRIAEWPVMISLPNWLELRTYNSAALHEGFTKDGLFARSGIRPLLSELGNNLTYLIPFDSLAERNQAWTLFDADPEWHILRREHDRVSVIEITIYSAYPGGRIFERSL